MEKHLYLNFILFFMIILQLGSIVVINKRQRAYCLSKSNVDSEYSRFAIAKVSKNLSQNITAYIGSDYPRTWPIPDAPRVLLFIEDSVHYRESDSEWDALAPGNGTIYLGENDNPFSISMFHQMRCLNVIRKGIVNWPPKSPELTRHCLNYLRQIILCRSDLFLESLHGEADQYRTCKDWSVIYAQVEKNQQEHSRRTVRE